MDNRLGNYKKAGVSADSLRRSRVENAVSLRKEKRDEVMSKRRNIQPEDHEDSRDYSEGESNINVNKIRELVVQTRSSDMTVKREAVQKIRKALSGDTKPPIDDMIRAGVTKALVECVDYDDPDVKFEACWGLTNIAGGEPHQTAAVVEAGAVPRLIKLLGSSDTNLCDQAVWGLGNVIGDGAYLRDYCIELGIMEPLMKLLTTPSLPRSLVRNIAWLIVNLCRFKCPRPTPLVIQALLPSLRFFLEDPDARVVREGMWALAYLTDGGDEIVQEVIKLGLGRMAVPMLCHSDVGVQTAAIRVVGNIATGTDEQTQFLLDYGILRQLPTMLTHRKSKISKEAAWLCSNITAGTEQQVQAVVDANLVPYLIQLLELGDAPTRTEATWAIANITISGTAEQACYLVDQNVIPPLCGILGVVGGDPTILLVVLDAIHNILRKSGNREEEVCVKIEECGGLGTIERLEAHENEQIYHKAYDIIVEYFSQGDDRDEGDFWTAPGDGNTRRTKDEQMDVPEGGFSFK